MGGVARSLVWFLFVGLLSSCAGEPAPPASDQVAAAAPDGASGGSGDSPKPVDGGQTVLFLGDSLSAGYGLDDSADAFPALIQKRIDGLGWNFEVVNAGVSGDTTAGGLRRVDWLLKRPIDVLVLELGGNDGLRGVALEDTRKNLQGIIDRVREKNPGVSIVIAGMMIPPNLGPEYTTEFRSIFPDLAKGNDATLIPFLLDGVGGQPGLNQADGIHPTTEGHQVVASVVWKYLQPVLEGRRSLE